jgi:hypothetical protein
MIIVLRILIADDHQIVRPGVRIVLEQQRQNSLLDLVLKVNIHRAGYARRPICHLL